jgi:hypothetical protein
MLHLAVTGYMASMALDEIANAGYTRFQGTIGISDAPAGLYPTLDQHQLLARQRSYVRWAIGRMADASVKQQSPS